MDEPLPMNPGQLPESVRSLIDRKLRLLKREFEKQNGIKRSRIIDEMDKSIQESFCVGSIGNAFIAVPLDAYRELTKQLVDEVISWPALVVEAILSIFTKAGVSLTETRELDALVDAHAWSMADGPPQLGHASPEQFSATVHQMISRFGPVDPDFWTAFKNHFDLSIGAGFAMISNEGRWARESAAVAIEEFLVANRRAVSGALAPDDGNRPPNLDAREPDPVASPCPEFVAMQGLTADELKICWVGDRAEEGIAANGMLSVSARGISKRVPLAMLGLVNKTTGRLNHQGAALLGLARGARALRTEKNAKRISRLRSNLQMTFGLSDDPFEPYRKGSGWVPRFSVADLSGAADERARRAGELRHVPLEAIDIYQDDQADRSDTDGIGSEVEQDADEWLRRNDPQWRS